MRKFDDNIVCTQKQNEIHAPILHVMHLFCWKRDIILFVKT